MLRDREVERLCGLLLSRSTARKGNALRVKSKSATQEAAGKEASVIFYRSSMKESDRR